MAAALQRNRGPLSDTYLLKPSECLGSEDTDFGLIGTRRVGVTWMVWEIRS